MIENYDWNRLSGIYPADFVEKMKDDPCWKNYQMVGMKKKGGRSVPNCVPLDSKHSENPLDEMAIANAFKKEPGTGSSMRMPKLEGVKKEPIDDFEEHNPAQSNEPNAAMATNQLRVMQEKIDIMLDMLEPGNNLEPWMSAKLTMSSQNLASVADALRFGVET